MYRESPITLKLRGMTPSLIDEICRTWNTWRDRYRLPELTVQAPGPEDVEAYPPVRELRDAPGFAMWPDWAVLAVGKRPLVELPAFQMQRVNDYFSRFRAEQVKHHADYFKDRYPVLKDLPELSPETIWDADPDLASEFENSQVFWLDEFEVKFTLDLRFYTKGSGFSTNPACAMLEMNAEVFLPDDAGVNFSKYLAVTEEITEDELKTLTFAFLRDAADWFKTL
jgi:hypothetical protein